MNKIGKKRLNEIDNLVVFEIIQGLILSPNNSNGLSKVLGKNQAGVYNQLKILKEKNYIISSNIKKNAYQVNYSKIIYEFILYIDEKLKDNYDPTPNSPFEMDPIHKTLIFKELWENNNEYIVIFLEKIINHKNENSKYTPKNLRDVFYIGLMTIKNLEIVRDEFFVYYRQKDRKLMIFYILIEQIKHLQPYEVLRNDIERGVIEEFEKLNSLSEKEKEYIRKKRTDE